MTNDDLDLETYVTTPQFAERCAIIRRALDLGVELSIPETAQMLGLTEDDYVSLVEAFAEMKHGGTAKMVRVVDLRGLEFDDPNDNFRKPSAH